MKRQPLIVEITVLVILVGALSLLIVKTAPVPSPHATETESQPAAVAAATSSAPVATSTRIVATSTRATTTVQKAPATPSKPADTSSQGSQIHRVENPYSMPALSFESVNEIARAALVNIFCTTKTGALRPISGSGVIIDPKGIILTNAHVAQYILLARSNRVNLSCTIRSGAPATPKWIADVMYMPEVWVQSHAADIKKEKPLGTGANDYALLAIVDTVDGRSLPTSFPYLPFDTREAIGFIGDNVLSASYPAEFLGVQASFTMYPATSISVIRHLYTLAASTVDVISVGGVLEAQSGSSGGAIVNAWGRLIGLIATTSEGATTAERDLRGITLSYIDRDMEHQSGYPLAEMLQVDPEAQVEEFKAKIAPTLIDLLMTEINK